MRPDEPVLQSAGEGNKASGGRGWRLPEPGEVRRKLRYVGRELLPIEVIVLPPWADDIRFRTKKALNKLAASLVEHGQLEPIKVHRRPDGTYMVFNGISRYEAAVAVGLSHLWADIYEGDVSPDELYVLADEEARTQQGTGPISLARRIRYYRRHFGLSWADIGRRLGISDRWARELVKLLKLPPKVQEAVENGDLKVKEALALLAGSNKELGSVCESEPSGPEEAETAAEYNARSLASEWAIGRPPELPPLKEAKRMIKLGTARGPELVKALVRLCLDEPEKVAIALGAPDMAQVYSRVRDDPLLESVNRDAMARSFIKRARKLPYAMAGRIRPFLRRGDDGEVEWDEELLRRKLEATVRLDDFTAEMSRILLGPWAEVIREHVEELIPRPVIRKIGDGGEAIEVVEMGPYDDLAEVIMAGLMDFGLRPPEEWPSVSVACVGSDLWVLKAGDKGGTGGAGEGATDGGA